MKSVQQFIFLTVYFPPVNYAASFFWLFFCSVMFVTVQWKRSQANTVVAPLPVPIPVFWYSVVSGSCPGMCPPAVSLKNTTTDNRCSLCFVFFSLSNNLLFVPITTIKRLLSQCVGPRRARIRDRSLETCVSLSLRTCGMGMRIYTCVFFPALLALVWRRGSYLSRPAMCVIAQGDRQSLFG